MSKNNKSQKLAYENACLSYIESFLDKHKLANRDWNWIKLGALVQIGNQIIDFFDIKFDLDNNKKLGLFEKFMQLEDKYFTTYDEYLKENML